VLTQKKKPWKPFISPDSFSPVETLESVTVIYDPDKIVLLPCRQENFLVQSGISLIFKIKFSIFYQNNNSILV